MGPGEVYKDSIGEKPDPEQDLLDVIHAREDEIAELMQIGVPENQIQSIRGEVDSYREELEDLLAA